jgi:hypothetical protein
VTRDCQDTTWGAEWDGSGVVTFGGDAVVASRGTTAAGRGFADLLVTPTDSGISMRIEATTPSDPVRGFNVWMPAWNGRSFVGERWQPGATFSPFHPLFLERLAPFKTLRFMDLRETNTSDIVTWADRRDAADIRQGSGPEGTPSEPIVNGMSLEYMVQLANVLDAAGLDLYVDYRFTGQAGAGEWGDLAKLHRMDEPLTTAWNYAAVVAAADGSLWNDTLPIQPPFTSVRTVGTVDFGTIAAGYAVRTSGVVIPVTWSGRNASASAPGGGWAAVGARRSGAGYEVLWRHAALGLVGTWMVDAAGRQVSARGLSLAEAKALETQIGFDVTGDGIVGAA